MAGQPGILRNNFDTLRNRWVGMLCNAVTSVIHGFCCCCALLRISHTSARTSVPAEFCSQCLLLELPLPVTRHVSTHCDMQIVFYLQLFIVCCQLLSSALHPTCAAYSCQPHCTQPVLPALVNRTAPNTFTG